MSETAPEAPPARGSSGGNVFTQRIGPLPMWAWVAVIGGALIAWRLYSSHKAAATAAQTDTSSVPADQVPQFVNQTYVQTTAPVVTPAPPGPAGSPGPAGPPGQQGIPGTAPPPKPTQLTRTWRSLGGSTYAEVTQRLLGNTEVANLHPADAKTANWVKNVYGKNHNAKMPKGLNFTYSEGTVTAKGK